MPSFVLAEPVAKSMSGHAAAPYAVGSIPAQLHTIARVLTGSVDFADFGSNKTIKPRKNYLTGLGAIESPQGIARAISEDLGLAKYEAFLLSHKYKNIGFFSILSNSLAQCIYDINKGNNTDSFVHLYRCIEFISEACAVLYVTRQDDFLKSMAFFKTVHSHENLGAIGLLTSTCQQIAEYEQLSELTFDYIPSMFSDEHIELLGSQLNMLQIGNMEGVELVWDAASEYRVSVAFSAVPEFISRIRNRAYHNQRAQKNMDLYAIGGFSDLSQMLTAPTLSWFATMYFTLLRALIVRTH